MGSGCGRRARRSRDDPAEVAEARASKERFIYTWSSGGYELTVIYAMSRPGAFVSKQIVITKAPAATYRVNDVQVLRGELLEPVADRYLPGSRRANLGTGDYGVFLRFADKRGLLAAVQNPFPAGRRQRCGVRRSLCPGHGVAVGLRTVRRRPRVCSLPIARPVGQCCRRQMPAEWVMPSDASAVPPGMDREPRSRRSPTWCARSCSIDRRAPLNVMVGWCVNDYQIDVATAEGRAEYRRIIDQGRGARRPVRALRAVELGAVAARGRASTTGAGSTRCGSGLGQQIRSGPVGRQDRCDSSRRCGRCSTTPKSKQVKLLAYVYPVLPFAQNPAWLVVRQERSDAITTRASANRALQDWLIDTLVTFHQRTGIGGYAFDHTFLTYDGTSRVRAVGGLAAGDGGAAAARAGHRHRRTAGVSPVRSVVVARRQLSAPDRQRRAAGALRAVSRSALRPRLGRSPALHRVSLPDVRLRAERDRARLHHPPDAAQR